MTKILSLTCCALLAACSASDTDPGPGGVSVGEARALDEAAEMIEARRLPQQGSATEDTPPEQVADEPGDDDSGDSGRS